MRDRHARERVGEADVVLPVVVLADRLAIDQQTGALLFRHALPKSAVEASVMRRDRS